MLHEHGIDFCRFKVPEGPPPWAQISSRSSPGRTVNKGSKLLEKWDGQSQFRQQVVDELIKDCIHAEVAGLVGGTLAVSGALFLMHAI